MSPLNEALLTAMRELRRNLRSAKGLVMGLLFLLGGGAASLIYVVAVSELTKPNKDGQEIPAEAFQDARQQFWTQMWSEDIGNYLADSPWIFVGLFKASLWFIPFLTLMIGFEQVSGDLQYRTIRYSAVRARRASLVAGKALGIWAVVSTLLLLLNMFVWLVSLIRGEATMSQIALWGPRMWALAAVFAAAYSGLTILISSLTRRPILSLFIGLIVFSSMWVADMAVDAAKRLESETFAFLVPMGYALPDFYETWLVTPKAPELVGGIAVLLAYGAVATALAAFVVIRRDV